MDTHLILRTLRLTDFRNYASLEWEAGSGLNLLVGRNAQGKTNLLEAIYLLATTRSLRASRESELIRIGAETVLVSADIERKRDGESSLDLAIQSGEKKTVRINGSRRTRSVDLLGELNAVYFGARDLEIVQGEPSARRRLLNLEISQVSPKYVYDLAAFKRALEQRNRLLRDLRDRPPRDDSLDAWTEQLIQYGASLMAKRADFLTRLQPLAAESHSYLTDGAERLEIAYRPSVAAEDTSIEGCASALREGFSSVARDEMRRGVSLLGPQRDDFLVTIQGMEARSFGSQGQQRTAALSIRLAELVLMEEYVGEPPVLLLDDVMSDLDDHRRQRLLSWIHDRCQTLLTCTETREFPPEVLTSAAIWNVDKGVVTRAAA